MKRVVLLALAAAFAIAQPATVPPAPLAANEVLRVVEVKNASAGNIRDNLAAIFPGITMANGRLIIRGQAPVVDMIEDAIKKLDVPPPTSPEARPVPNVELTVQLLYGSAMEGKGTPIPAELEPTVRQLRTLFPYKSYKLLDTQLLHARSNGNLSATGTLPGSSSLFVFNANPIVSSGPSARTIRLAQLRLVLREPNGAQLSEATISGDFDAKEGQKIVVGKANLINSDDAIILVITPKIIE